MAEKPLVVEEFNGLGTIANSVVVYAKGTPKFAYVLGDVEGAPSRFLAVVAKEDRATLAELAAGDCCGRHVAVRSEEAKNYFRFS